MILNMYFHNIRYDLTPSSRLSAFQYFQYFDLFLWQYSAICTSNFGLHGKTCSQFMCNFRLNNSPRTCFSDSEAGGRGHIGFDWHHRIYIRGLI